MKRSVRITGAEGSPRRAWQLALGLLALGLLPLVGCGGRGIGPENLNNNANQNANQNLNENENQHPVVPVEIQLTIYDPSGQVVQTLTVQGMGPQNIAPPLDEPNPYSTGYVVMAQAEGYYTRLFPCDYGDTVDVQLDAVPALSRALTGVVIYTSYFSPPYYDANATLQAVSPNGTTTRLTTDDEGRYRLTDGAEGTWDLQVLCDVWQEPYPSRFELDNGAGTDYQDLFVEIDMSADAPNLYLYPAHETDVDVSLGFPQGGEVVLSDPPYEDGWQVTAAPDGTLDGHYPYLFYEARLPYQVQRERGWVFGAAALESGFTDLLVAYGFTGRELSDFLDYWIPLLTDAPYYGVYPLAADALVTLDIRPAPDHLRRLWLLLEPLQAPVSVPPPALPAPLPRDGFTAVEWGAFLSR